ncbi:Putative flavin-containing protein [Madurella fahalii]|uniref:Flavin-containing protein n=1 Tax=Madurella fahalii TaxID=1157608 RepID=A0ABQ0GJU5_9PEZI
MATIAAASAADQSHLPSHERVVPGSVNLAPAAWPRTAVSATASIDAAGVAQRTISALNAALAQADLDAITNLFLPDDPDNNNTNNNPPNPDPNPNGTPNSNAAAATTVPTPFWRDHLALAFSLRTLRGRAAIRAYLTSLPAQALKGLQLEVDGSSAFRAPQVAGFRPGGDVRGVGFFVKVENGVGTGRGVVRLVESGGEGQWKIWTLYTALEELRGFEEARGPRREVGVQHGSVVGRKNWEERRREEAEFGTEEPEVLIIGAGQGGLSIAARLKMLGVSALIIERNAAVGDNWRQRYSQLVLHDPVWYDHMPYIPFPDSWPVFTPKDKMADWLEFYARTLDLNVWTSTSLVSQKWDGAKNQWTVVIERVRGDNGQTETRTLHAKHIVLATGHSGKANMPIIPGMEAFKGDRLCHSTEFDGAKVSAKGKKAVVVGACNSGMDICQDFVEKGYDVTLVQRSSTCVPSSDGALKITFGVLYEEGGPPTEDSDLWVQGWPFEVLKSIQVDLTKFMVEHDKEMLEGLEKAGFKTDTGPHGSGVFSKYIQKAGGYYIDVGGSQLIIDGKIKVKQGQEVVEVLPKGLKFADGTELEADEVVFATGYDNMKTTARAIFGDELVGQVGDVWGLDEEGEMRTIWRESGHPGFWFHGGNLALCRYFSRLLALQIKARLEGLDIRP